MAKRLLAWGWSTGGSLGVPEELATNPDNIVAPHAEVPSAVPWKSVSGNSYFSVAIKEDGTLWTAGCNFTGNLGRGIADPDYISFLFGQVGSDDTWVKAIAAQLDFAVALKADGTLWLWGSDLRAGVPTWQAPALLSPVQIGPDSDWVDFSANYNSIVAIKEDGTAWGLGNNTDHALGLLAATWYTEFAEIEGVSDCAKVICGPQDTVIIKADGTMWGFGTNDTNILGDGYYTNFSTPKPMFTHAEESYPGAGEWAGATIGWDYFVGMKTDGTLWASGSSTMGLNGLSSDLLGHIFTKAGVAAGWKHILTDGNSCNTFFVHESGRLFMGGSYDYGGLGVVPDAEHSGELPFPLEIDLGGSVAWASGGDDCCFALVDDAPQLPVQLPSGALFGAGQDLDCELGLQKASAGQWQRHHVEPIEDFGPIKDVCFALGASFIVLQDGTMLGNGYSGYLGIGPAATAGRDDCQWVPIGDGGWSKCFGGVYRDDGFFCALKNDGTLWWWPKDGVPSQFGDRTDWAHVWPVFATNLTYGTSSWAVYALTTSGDLYGWGVSFFKFDADGQSTSNTAVFLASGVRLVSGDGAALFALMEDGRLFIAGRNTDYCLGQVGQLSEYLRFTQIGGTWSHVETEGRSTLLVDTAGVVHCCGKNTHGQIFTLGVNPVESITPSPIFPKVKDIALSLGGGDGWFIDLDGTLWQTGWDVAPFNKGMFPSFSKIYAGYQCAMFMTSTAAGAVHFWTNFSGQTEIL